MANPVLNDRAFEQAARTDGDAGWAAPAATDTVFHEPITDGPISPYQSVRTGVMTVGGAATATGVLLVLLVAAGAVGWSLVKPDATGQTVTFPGWLLLPLFAALGIAIVTAFKPTVARFTAPVYAILEGLVVGAISSVFNYYYSGIVIQAVGATIGVFVVMLALYGLRIIKVTERFRRMVIGATFGVLLLYGISLLFSLFGHTPSFLYDASAFGIGLSILVAGIAAFNLTLDFDIIERGAKAGAPKYMEWYAGFGLLVTLVWLYLELLRLLARLRSR
jgi:uncharacterized YccA/Bax inhibitor family protein